MRLESLQLKNFRGFSNRDFSLHPQFNLVIGENGTGKTSFLEAVAVSIGSWLLGFRGQDSRHIRPKDVRREIEFIERRYRQLPQYPVVVKSTAILEYAEANRNNGEITILEPPKTCQVTWSRKLNGDGGKTTQADAAKLKKKAGEFYSSVLNRKPLILPLIRYFGAGRLWESVRETNKQSIPKKKTRQLGEHFSLIDQSDEISSPFYGYRLSVDKRCNPEDLIRWMANERRNEIDEEEKSPSLQLVYRAIQLMLPEAKTVRYANKLKTLVIHQEEGKILRFSDLSDGYRNVIAIAADLAIKAAMLNPQLAEKALEHTPGIVLIDELDLHLHPKWQRRVIEDLRRTFPKIQFICTTHSPFLVQSLRSGEELIVLDGQPTAHLADMQIEEIVQGLMGVPKPQVSLRYSEMKGVAHRYLETLEESSLSPPEKLEEYKKKLAESIAPYADNPAFQAFLEMKLAAKLGGD